MKTAVKGLALTGATMLLATSNVIHPARATSSSSSSSSGVCSAERQACLGDADCQECESIAALAGGADYAASSTDDYTCRYAYPDSFTYSAVEGGLSITCDIEGALHCCSFFGDEESAQECMSNDAATALWDCLMGTRNCSVYDMPCHPESSVVCKADLVVCEEDAECSSCLASTKSTSSSSMGDVCEDRYPDVFARTGYEGGFAGGYCGVAGAGICCEFEDNSSASDCLSNAAMAAYQSCVMDDDGCLAEDIPCLVDVTTTSSSSEVVPTPSSLDTMSSDTPSPTEQAPTSTTSSDSLPDTSTATPAPSVTLETDDRNNSTSSSSTSSSTAATGSGATVLDSTPSPSLADENDAGAAELSGAATVGLSAMMGSPRGALLISASLVFASVGLLTPAL